MYCVKCGNGDCTHDKVSNLYFCKRCNFLFDEEDILKEIEKDLNPILCIFLHIIMCVPVIDLCVLTIVNNIDLKKEHVTHICTRYVANIVILCIVGLYAVLVYKGVQNNIITEQAFIQSELLDDFSIVDNSWKDNISSAVIENLNNDISQSVSDSQKVVSPLERYTYLDEAIITGKIARDIVNESIDMKFAYLIQSEDIAIRYGKTSYRNVGRVLSISEEDDENRSFCKMSGNDKYSFRVREDIGDIVEQPIDALFEDRFIWCLNMSDLYVVHVLQDIENNIIGFAFQEYKR